MFTASTNEIISPDRSLTVHIPHADSMQFSMNEKLSKSFPESSNNLSLPPYRKLASKLSQTFSRTKGTKDHTNRIAQTNSHTTVSSPCPARSNQPIPQVSYASAPSTSTSTPSSHRNSPSRMGFFGHLSFKNRTSKDLEKLLFLSPQESANLYSQPTSSNIKPIQQPVYVASVNSNNSMDSAMAAKMVMSKHPLNTSQLKPLILAEADSRPVAVPSSIRARPLQDSSDRPSSSTADQRNSKSSIVTVSSNTTNSILGSHSLATTMDSKLGQIVTDDIDMENIDSANEDSESEEDEDEEEKINPGYKQWKKQRRSWTNNFQQVPPKPSSIEAVPESAYPKIYDLLVAQSKPLKEPMNLADALRVIKAGWVATNQWPPAEETAKC